MNPVDLTTDRKLIPDEIDFSLPGLMPIEWSRFYASDLTVDSMLGRGWVLPWEQRLRRSGGFVYHTDNQGRSVPFIDLEPGESIYNPHERIHLVRTEAGHYILQTLDNVFFYFGEVSKDNREGSPCRHAFSLNGPASFRAAYTARIVRANSGPTCQCTCQKTRYILQLVGWIRDSCKFMAVGHYFLTSDSRWIIRLKLVS